MGEVVFDISMSLDGFITGPNEGIEHPLGEDDGRLHDWMFDRKTAADAEVLDEVYAPTRSSGQADLRPGGGALG